jgi:hypothetical protein
MISRMVSVRWPLLLVAGLFAGFATGCVGDDPTEEESDVVDSTQEELVVAGDVLAPSVGAPADGGTYDDSASPQSATTDDSSSGPPAPSDVRSEPVPHPWVPKLSPNDHDT